jgi:alpha-beta hydrolase superfamily lysophospholipase
MSDDRRDLAEGQLTWYGEWLADVVEQMTSGPVVPIGHSFGAAIVLSTRPPSGDRTDPGVAGRADPAAADPALLVGSAGWLVLPRAGSSARLLRFMHRPGFRPAIRTGRVDDVGGQALSVQRRPSAGAQVEPDGSRSGGLRRS